MEAQLAEIVKRLNVVEGESRGVLQTTLASDGVHYKTRCCTDHTVQVTSTEIRGLQEDNRVLMQRLLAVERRLDCFIGEFAEHKVHAQRQHSELLDQMYIAKLQHSNRCLH